MSLLRAYSRRACPRPPSPLFQMYHVNVANVIDMVGQKAESLSTRGQLRIMEFVRKYMVGGPAGGHLECMPRASSMAMHAPAGETWGRFMSRFTPARCTHPIDPSASESGYDPPEENR